MIVNERLLVLAHLTEDEEEALMEALSGAEEGAMNYYVGFHPEHGLKVFDGGQWLNRNVRVDRYRRPDRHGELLFPEADGFEFLWGVWSDGTLIRNP